MTAVDNRTIKDNLSQDGICLLSQKERSERHMTSTDTILHNYDCLWTKVWFFINKSITGRRTGIHTKKPRHNNPLQCSDNDLHFMGILGHFSALGQQTSRLTWTKGRPHSSNWMDFRIISKGRRGSFQIQKNVMHIFLYIGVYI